VSYSESLLDGVDAFEAGRLASTHLPEQVN
jgi:hypothetical protein